MDQILEQKLKGIVETARKIEAIQESIAEKEQSVALMERARTASKGLPHVESTANQAITSLKSEIAEEKDQLVKLKETLYS